MTWVMRHEFGSQSLVLKLLLIFSSDDWQGPAPKSCPLSLESACGSRAKWHRTSGSHLASLPPSAAPKFCCFKSSLSGQLSNDSGYIFLYFFSSLFCIRSSVGLDHPSLPLLEIVVLPTEGTDISNSWDANCGYAIFEDFLKLNHCQFKSIRDHLEEKIPSFLSL